VNGAPGRSWQVFIAKTSNTPVLTWSLHRTHDRGAFSLHILSNIVREQTLLHLNKKLSFPPCIILILADRGRKRPIYPSPSRKHLLLNVISGIFLSSTHRMLPWWGYPRRGVGLRHKKSCRKVPFQVTLFRWRHFALPSMSLALSTLAKQAWLYTYAG
jgi:hypothetical protein